MKDRNTQIPRTRWTKMVSFRFSESSYLKAIKERAAEKDIYHFALAFVLIHLHSHPHTHVHLLYVCTCALAHTHTLTHGNFTTAEGKRILPRSVWATWQGPISNNNNSKDNDKNTVVERLWVKEWLPYIPLVQACQGYAQKKLLSMDYGFTHSSFYVGKRTHVIFLHLLTSPPPSTQLFSALAL